MKKSDLMETTLSMVTGMCINFVLTFTIFGVSPFFALGTSCLFFCVSWVRTYLIRRLFRWNEPLMNKTPKNYLDLERLCQEIVRQDELRGADLKEMREILKELLAAEAETML